MLTDSPQSAATSFALEQRRIMPHALWSIFSVIEDDKKITLQGATMYASGSAVIPFQLVCEKG